MHTYITRIRTQKCFHTHTHTHTPGSTLSWSASHPWLRSSSLYVCMYVCVYVCYACMYTYTHTTEVSAGTYMEQTEYVCMRWSAFASWNHSLSDACAHLRAYECCHSWWESGSYACMCMFLHMHEMHVRTSLILRNFILKKMYSLYGYTQCIDAFDIMAIPSVGAHVHACTHTRTSEVCVCMCNGGTFFKQDVQKRTRNKCAQPCWQVH